MANSPQARKRVRQNEKRHQHNASYRSMTRTLIKRTKQAIESKVLETAQAAYQKMVPVLDRMGTKGLFSKNKMARHKSKLFKRLKDLTLSSTQEKH